MVELISAVTGHGEIVVSLLRIVRYLTAYSELIVVKLTKGNVFELANRSRGSRPLVMPNLLGSRFIPKQLGKSSATIADQLEFAERYGYAPYIVAFYSPLVDLLGRWADHLCWDEDVVEDERVTKKTRTFVDAMQTAVRGYEQFSPRLYEEHITPYLQASSKQAQAGGVLFWIHTCGHMKGRLENMTYHRFGLDILECLNYPPAGDVDDWPRLRKFVPEATIAKGNLEDSLLWQGPIEKIKSKTWEILEESAGFKHILATSNNIFNDTPLEHFEAMMEAVDEYCAANRLG